jgi:hypothetical protein
MSTEAAQPSVSVVIPCYNSSGTLLRAIDSVRRQTVPVAEIIVVDDGSTDGSADLVEAQCPDVTLLRQANAGSAAARNTGMREARGAFIALLDADDVWLPHRIETELPVMAREPEVGLVCGGIRWLTSAEAPLPQARPCAEYHIGTAAQVMCNHHVPTSTVLLRREVIASVGVMNETLRTSQDTEYFFRLIAKGWRIAYCEAILAVGFNQQGSSSTNYLGNAQMLQSIIEAWDPGHNPASPVTGHEYARAYAMNLRLAGEYATVGRDFAQARGHYRLAAGRAGAPLWLRAACGIGVLSPTTLELATRVLRRATGRRSLQRRSEVARKPKD